jgi:hypothetical protein
VEDSAAAAAAGGRPTRSTRIEYDIPTNEERVRALRQIWVLGIFLAVVLGFAAAAADLPGYVYWNVERPLTWGDFQAVPPSWAEPANSAARIHLALTWSASIGACADGPVVTATVTAFTIANAMDPALSWKSPLATLENLRHEQFHFNLHEVYRRLAEMTLAPLTVRQAVKPNTSAQDAADACEKALNDLLLVTWDGIGERAKAALAAYDSETRHGLDTEAQATWEIRITGLLADPGRAP